MTMGQGRFCIIYPQSLSKIRFDMLKLIINILFLKFLKLNNEMKNGGKNISKIIYCGNITGDYLLLCVYIFN